jgi:hypothetical protein
VADDDAADCPIDFNTFVLSLSSATLSHMNDEGEGTTPKVQLALAKQTIDILALLQSKTTGNLTGEEERLLEHVLGEVRVAYTKKARG